MKQEQDLVAKGATRSVSAAMSAQVPLTEDQRNRRTSHRLAQLTGSEVAVGCKNRCYAAD